MEPSAVRPAGRSPWLIVALGGGVAGIAFAWLTWSITGPLVYLDELIYMDAATSLAHGHGLGFRDGAYGYGPVYPTLVSVVVRLVDDRVLAYHVVLALNALVVASAVVPLFLVARRLLDGRSAALAAVACLALPSTFYAAYVMTDALGYVVALWAALALVRALERPSLGRQALVLGACALSAAVRPQLVVLLPTYLVAVLAFGWARRAPLWPTLRSHVLLVAAVVAGALVVAVAGLLGRGPDLLGSYSVLWSSVSPVETLRWTLYHVWDAVLYVWVLPAIVLPAALVGLWRRAPADAGAGAVVAVTTAITVCTLLIVGVFSATPWAESRLHDRYLIFVFPLWVLVLVDWAARGAKREGRVTLVAAVAAVVLAVAVPYHGVIAIETPNVFDGVATTAWSVVGDAFGTTGILSARLVLLALVLAAAVCAVRLGTERLRLALGLALGLVALSAAAQWIGAISISDRGTFADTSEASQLWVDRAADGRRVTTLFVGTEACNEEAFLRAQLTTEFFNASIGPLVAVGEPYGGPERARVRPDGALVTRAGAPVRADVVLAYPELRLRGTRIATGTTSHFGLWRVDGPVVVVGGAGPSGLGRACSAPPPPVD